MVHMRMCTVDLSLDMTLKLCYCSGSDTNYYALVKIEGTHSINHSEMLTSPLARALCTKSPHYRHHVLCFEYGL